MTTKPPEEIFAAVQNAILNCTGIDISPAFASRGKNKGRLLKRKPADAEAAAIWLAFMFEVNPHKAGVGSIIMLPREQRANFDNLSKVVEFIASRWDIRPLDGDRHALETLGVW